MSAVYAGMLLVTNRACKGKQKQRHLCKGACINKQCVLSGKYKIYCYRRSNLTNYALCILYVVGSSVWVVMHTQITLVVRLPSKLHNNNRCNFRLKFLYCVQMYLRGMYQQMCTSRMGGCACLYVCNGESLYSRLFLYTCTPMQFHVRIPIHPEKCGNFPLLNTYTSIYTKKKLITFFSIHLYTYISPIHNKTVEAHFY